MFVNICACVYLCVSALHIESYVEAGGLEQYVTTDTASINACEKGERHGALLLLQLAKQGRQEQKCDHTQCGHQRKQEGQARRASSGVHKAGQCVHTVACEAPANTC